MKLLIILGPRISKFTLGLGMESKSSVKLGTLVDTIAKVDFPVVLFGALLEANSRRSHCFGYFEPNTLTYSQLID